MAIFGKPMPEVSRDDEDVKILFLHGLEGSTQGAKSKHLAQKWGARSAFLRTNPLLELQSKHSGIPWQEMPTRELKSAVKSVYSDALAAVEYDKPDLIVGSSMGGALLMKLIIEAKWNGPSVFLAPAIEGLLGHVDIPELSSSVCLLAEVDQVVPNGPNIKKCQKALGNLMVSPNDDHRLSGALSSGLIDCAIVTAIELSSSKM